ncbi:putative peroxisomal biogenesis factor 11 (PEX11) [Lyophyllum shimeji]|uniref:Peroxisomal biogenesis factor 11 (PEX11) n=1 Tax=Lyophyllum shimeji TaxID=47721 RepID=A0A9P3UHW8_LYOSH|nr:putative peroxisomal biogenesis factor 11 (PEX11) [Lyophyllum shimeji]
MSSMSFPSEHHGSSSHEQTFYSPPFDASASFQMNPLSAHPPRTPRSSIVANKSAVHVYGQAFHDPADDTEPLVVDKEDVRETEEDEEEEDKSKVEGVRVRKEEVWRDLFLTSNGRDKAFKLIQYSIRLYLLFHTSISTTRLLRRPTRPQWEAELVKRLSSTASGLSFTRKLLLLFNWLGPLTTITAQQSVPYSTEVSVEKSKKTTRPFLHTVLYAPPPVLLELVHSVADDVATLSLLGLLGKKLGDRAGRFSDWCWLLATLVGLVENGVERQMIGNLQQQVESRLYAESMTGATAKSRPKDTQIDERELSRLRKQDYWLQITRAKYIMDLIFVSYDLFRIQRFREPAKTLAGLAAAILSSMKLYHGQRNIIRKKPM